jgi:hypothetical protein
MTRICFATCITGKYELKCKKPATQTIPCDFIVYTDASKTIETHGVWRTVDVGAYEYGVDHGYDSSDAFKNSLWNNRHPFNRAKFVKLNLHRLPELAGYDIVVWLDGTIEITDPTCAERCVALIGDAPIIFRHEHRRGNLKAEVDDSMYNKYIGTWWNGHEQPAQDVQGQYVDYVKDGFVERWIEDPIDEHDGVWITCFVAWNMRSPRTKEFLDMWWRENLVHTTQDQVSFPYVAWKTGIRPLSLPSAGIGGAEPHKKTDFYVKHDHGR